MRAVSNEVTLTVYYLITFRLNRGNAKKSASTDRDGVIIKNNSTGKIESFLDFRNILR